MPQNKSEIIRALFAAYRANDRNAVENSFTADFTFTSPYDDEIDKATYFERCWPASVSGWLKAQTIERILVQDEQAFVTYQCITTDGKSFRNTEFFTFEGERIKRIDVYFGATYQGGVFVKQKA
jgi:ketosteroid isomerase-like protein